MRSSPDHPTIEGQARKAAHKAGLIARKLSRDEFMLIQPENNVVVAQRGLTAAEVVTYCAMLSAKEELHLPAAADHALDFRRRKRRP